VHHVECGNGQKFFLPPGAPGGSGQDPVCISPSARTVAWSPPRISEHRRGVASLGPNRPGLPPAHGDKVRA